MHGLTKKSSNKEVSSVYLLKPLLILFGSLPTVCSTWEGTSFSWSWAKFPVLVTFDFSRVKRLLSCVHMGNLSAWPLLLFYLRFSSTLSKRKPEQKTWDWKIQTPESKGVYQNKNKPFLKHLVTCLLKPWWCHEDNHDHLNGWLSLFPAAPLLSAHCGYGESCTWTAVLPHAWLRPSRCRRSHQEIYFFKQTCFRLFVLKGWESPFFVVLIQRRSLQHIFLLSCQITQIFTDFPASFSILLSSTGSPVLKILFRQPSQHFMQKI